MSMLSTPRLPDGGSDPQFMQSLARGLAVLEAFSDHGSDQTISRLTEHTQLPRSVVVRCLHTLVQLGYLEQQEKSYRPRPRVLRLADAFLSDRSLPAIAQPILEELRDELSESCSLGVLEGDEIIYAARASQSRIMAVSLHVGSRLPAWCTSMGRVLLASLPVEQREALVPSCLAALTPNTQTDRRELLKEITAVARQGYAVVDQELELGLRSIAVPVVDKLGVTVAALNAGTNAFDRSADELLDTFLPVLRAGAVKLSRLAP
ncbi:IclR family transcriptional regulator domain-containing protein [Sphingobium ummariense]|nr:IclR family transcriptional regulator C-terminal domain-containing protein [Sphingobium ummariense]